MRTHIQLHERAPSTRPALTYCIKTPVGIKIFGPDLTELDRIGRRIEELLPAVAGTRGVFAEKAMGGRYLNVAVDRAAASRHGLSVTTWKWR